MTSKRALTGLLGAFILSAAVNLPRQLNRHHHASRHVSVQVAAAIAADLLFAVVIWLVVLGILRLLSRRSSGGGGGGERPAPEQSEGPDRHEASRRDAEASFGGR